MKRPLPKNIKRIDASYEPWSHEDWEHFLTANAGLVQSLQDLPAMVRETPAVFNAAAHSFGYSVLTADTHPALLKPQQLLLWPECSNPPTAEALLSNFNVDGNMRLDLGDSLSFLNQWEPPTAIISDGPYGLASFPGDPPSPNALAEWYEPHLRAWHAAARTNCTLWFWNSEQGWAYCHRMIEDCGWEFRNCHIWDKGLAHVAGNVNSRTIRKFPVVTEVCVQYVRKNRLLSGDAMLPIRDWLRAEWKRTGLPFRETNVACNVKDAATRKYFSQDHLWYFPPAEAFTSIATYANQHGRPEGRPYFAKANGQPFSIPEWEDMRAKFHCELGITNVWHELPIRGNERLKNGAAAIHMNQKPLSLLRRCIQASTDPGDSIWEPFGGLCSASIAAIQLGRRAFAAEINPKFFQLAHERMTHETALLKFHRPATS